MGKDRDVERIRITVGQKNADILGADNRTLRAAVEDNDLSGNLDREIEDCRGGAQ